MTRSPDALWILTGFTLGVVLPIACAVVMVMR